MIIRRRTLRRLVYTASWRIHAIGQRLVFVPRPPWRQVLLPLFIVAIVGLIAAATPIGRHRGPSPQNTTAAVTVSSDHPSESRISPATYHSTAVGSEPKYLRLPSISTEGFIQKVGIDQHHQVAVPTNIHLAGWFTSTVIPGDPGLSIIDGHLDGYRQPGIFASLVKLKVGSAFSIELANGSDRHFQVKSVQSLSNADAAAALFSQSPGIGRQLNLITCGGTFDKTAKAYDHRIIITAEYIPARP